MSLESILAACAAKAYKTDPAGVASGVVEGIAFRASIPEGTLEMSVNLPEANLAKLQSKLSGRYPDNTVAYRNFGIVVTLPEMESLSGEDFLIFLGTAAKEAGKLIGVAYDDKFERDREPFFRLSARNRRGAAGSGRGRAALVPLRLFSGLAALDAGLFGEYGFLLRLPAVIRRP